MKYLKMLGLAAVAAAALMAFVGAGTASASVICSTTTTPCGSPWANGTVMEFSLVGTAKLTGAGVTLDTCTGGGVKGKLTNGSSTTTASGAIESLTWGPCTSTTDTTQLCSLEVHNISGTSNGTVTAGGSKACKVTINTPLFGSCVYSTGTSAIDLGTLTEGKSSGNTPDATLHVNTTVVLDSGPCPSTAGWEATYVLTAPTNTTLSVSAS